MTKVRSRKFLWDLGSWGFLSPHLALFLLFAIAPLFVNSTISLFNWSLLGKRVFVGLTNFIRIWTDDRFWQCVKNTSIFALVSVPLVIVVGILFALLLNQKIYGKLWILIGLVSQTFFGSIGILTTWKWIFASYPSGLANYVCMKLGILKNSISWFETPLSAWAVCTFVTVWWIVGFSVLLYLGAIQRIPPEQYEAAKMDGAGPLRRFWNITLPWMRSVLFFDIVRQVLLAFAIFDQMYIFTLGGPGGSTRTLVYYLYITGFQRQELGRAAAISWYIFVLVLAFGLIQLFMTTKSIKSAED
jgi:multiple sugar transport system permease protein